MPLSGAISITDIYRGIPTPVATVAARVDDVDHAVVVSSFLAVSDAPPLVAISVRDGSTSWPVLRRSPELGVSILSERHEHLLTVAWRLSSDRRLADADVRRDGQALLLADAPTTLTCSVVDEIRVGDHTLVVLRVCSADHWPALGRPIVHHDRQVNTLVRGGVN